MIKPLYILLVIAFYGCGGENANNSINSTEETKVDTIKCGELVLKHDFKRIIDLIDLNSKTEANKKEKDVCIEVIGFLGDVGFFRKIGKDTLAVVISLSKSPLKSMKMSECGLQQSLNTITYGVSKVIYALYFKEELNANDSLAGLVPIRVVKFKSR